jgi:hypothetical protein
MILSLHDEPRTSPGSVDNNLLPRLRRWDKVFHAHDCNRVARLLSMRIVYPWEVRVSGSFDITYLNVITGERTSTLVYPLVAWRLQWHNTQYTPYDLPSRMAHFFRHDGSARATILNALDNVDLSAGVTTVDLALPRVDEEEAGDIIVSLVEDPCDSFVEDTNQNIGSRI